jgi:hypothetical protein
MKEKIKINYLNKINGGWFIDKDNGNVSFNKKEINILERNNINVKIEERGDWYRQEDGDEFSGSIMTSSYYIRNEKNEDITFTSKVINNLTKILGRPEGGFPRWLCKHMN